MTISMTEEEYHEFCESDSGYCTVCNEITMDCDVEPDAEKYECPKCGLNCVMGIENALVEGFIEIE